MMTYVQYKKYIVITIVSVILFCIVITIFYPKIKIIRNRKMIVIYHKSTKREYGTSHSKVELKIAN